MQTFGKLKLIQHLYFKASMIYGQDNHWIYYDQNFVVSDDYIINKISYRFAMKFSIINI